MYITGIVLNSDESGEDFEPKKLSNPVFQRTFQVSLTMNTQLSYIILCSVLSTEL